MIAPGKALATAVCALLLATPAPAEESKERWRFYGGMIHFNWDTVGPSGHTVDCRTPTCDDADFDRGNLDTSMGFRVGAERLLLDCRRLLLRAGAEGSVRFTDYDLSQRELILVDLLGVVSIGADLGRVRPLLRLGLGGSFTDDGRGRTATFVEPALDIDLGNNVALRVATRWTNRNGPDDNDTSLLVVSRGNDGSSLSRWAVESSAGVSIPGGLVGEDLELSRGPYWQISLFRELGSGSNRVGFALDLMRAESTERLVFQSVPGNERTDELFGFAGIWDRRIVATARWRWRAGAGIKMSDWSDEFGLLLDEQNVPIVGSSTELGALVKTDVLLNPDSRFPLLLGLEQLYWPDIELGELRVRLGVELAL